MAEGSAVGGIGPVAFPTIGVIAVGPSVLGPPYPTTPVLAPATDFDGQARPVTVNGRNAYDSGADELSPAAAR